jgi:gliding motility-associated protein GldC
VNSINFAPHLNQAMDTSTIQINVTRDAERMIDKLNWSASNTTADEPREAKAMMLSLWDGADRAALRIDLWTKNMMVDEMADFFFQTVMGMADTYQSATRNQELSDDMRAFAKSFIKKFQEQQVKEGNALK